MWPAVHNLCPYRGDTLRMQLNCFYDDVYSTPADLTGVVATSQVRNKPNGDIIVSFECTITQPNMVDLLLTSEASNSLPKRGAWDCQLAYPDGDVVTVIRGSVNVKADITQPLVVAAQ
jgi:hypothetical protein